ncbi:MAG: hypothetical protein ABI383_14215, partial [Acidobacteriaceae bacterium]
RFDLVILCHSLPAAERRVITNLVHTHSSETPVILVKSRWDSDNFVDVAVDDNPAVLVDTLLAIFNRA